MLVKDHVFMLRFFLVVISFVLFIGKVSAYQTYEEEDGTKVLVEKTQAFIYVQPDIHSKTLETVERMASLKVISDKGTWYKVYINEQKKQIGYIQKADLFFAPVKVNNTMIIKKLGKGEVKDDRGYDEVHPNLEFDIFVDGQLVAHKSTTIPAEYSSTYYIKDVKLKNIEFIYVVDNGNNTCAEPHVTYYFTWDGKDFKQLEAGCVFCHDKPYDLKDITFPTEEKMKDRVLKYYAKAEVNEYDGLDITESKTETYQWNGHDLILEKTEHSVEKK